MFKICGRIFISPTQKRAFLRVDFIESYKIIFAENRDKNKYNLESTSIIFLMAILL